jgi:hypothetical protein
LILSSSPCKTLKDISNIQNAVLVGVPNGTYKEEVAEPFSMCFMELEKCLRALGGLTWDPVRGHNYQYHGLVMADDGR